MSHYDKKQKRILLVLLFIFFLLVTGIVIGGYVSYHNFELEFRHQAERQISAVGELKANGLADWRMERMGNAAVLSQNAVLSTLVQNFLQNPNNAQAKEQILLRLESTRIAYHYKRVFIVDPNGIELISSPSAFQTGDQQHNAVITQILKSGEIIFLDFHQYSDQSFHISIMVPIYANRGINQPLGVIVLDIDPTSHLYPYLSEWPTPSKTAETLLVRPDGEDVLFLNPVRFKQDAALNLRIPLTSKEVPAVQAVLKESGIVEGIDYRGESVLADARPIPDSPWFLVSKMDTAEVYAPIRERLLQTLLFISMAILVIVMGLITVWRQQRLLFYRTQAETAAALRESEEKFRQAFVISPDSININRMQDGMYVSVNNGFTKIMGYTTDEIIGKTSLELNIWANPQDRKTLVNGLIKNGEVQNLEVSFRAKQGGIKHGLMSASILMLNGIAHIISITRDITERIQAEKELRESEERYRTLVLNAPVITFATDKNGIFTLSEGMGLKKLGLQPGQVVGQSAIDMYHGYPSILNALKNALDGHNQRGEVEVLGSVFDIFYSPIFDSQGQVVKVIGVANDVTERKQAEDEVRKLNLALEQRVLERTSQLETANKELEAFSYSVSHDLRAPLRGIDGWSQALLEDYADKLDEQGRQYINRARSETQRMGHLIDDMLQLSRLTRAEMLKEQVDLSALAQAIIERLKQDEPDRQVDFNIQAGLKAEGDSHLLEAVLANLLGNAFKFTGKTPSARIEFGQTESNGQPVFFIRDNGAGFDMAYSQKLFGAFQRMHKSSEFPGTGIGLATVQRVIHRHGGRVWAEAEVGKGAVFYFTIG